MRTGVLIITILDHNSNSFLDSLDSLQKYTKSMSYWQLRLSDKQKNFNIIIGGGGGVTTRTNMCI